MKKESQITYIDHRRKFDNFPNYREVMMNSKGCHDGDWIGVICHGYGDGVNKERD